jgi:uncharacterized LabA/DUF88 family protein
MTNRIAKSAVFIDGANLHTAAKSLGFEIDYRRLLREFQSWGTLLRASYYTTVIEDGERPSLQPLLDWLTYNGYSVVTRPGREFTDQFGRRKFKGSISVELAIDAMETSQYIGRLVLFSGEGDFVRLVAAVQRLGVRVTVISAMATIAQELRRQTDEFVDLFDLKDKLGRDPFARR